MAEIRDVETPQGPARLHITRPDIAARRLRGAGPGTGDARGTVLLGHGAGGGIEAMDLGIWAEELVAAGWVVALVEQPWRVAGRKVAPRPAALDVAWAAVAAAVAGGPDALPGPYVHGGRSAGARVACRAATAGRGDGMPVAGLVLSSFPLHPPGKPGDSRVEELGAALATGIPAVLVQGARDPFGTRSDILGALGGGIAVAQLDSAEVPGTHSYPESARSALTSAVHRLVSQLGAAIG